MSGTIHDKDIQKMYLPDPSQLSLLPDGEATIINRPLANGYVFPGRGNSPHQLDNNVKTEDFSPSPKDGPIDTMPMDGSYKDAYAELIPPKPVPVMIVPTPARTIIKEMNMVPLFSAQLIPKENLVNGSMILVQQLVPYDPTRISVTIPMISTGQCALAISTSSDMSNAFIHDETVELTIPGQNQLFAGLLVYGVTIDIQFVYQINAMVLTERTLDSNP